MVVDVLAKVNLDNWAINNPCPGHTTGRAGVIFRNLINTIIVSQCALSSPCMYPDDFGPYLENQCCDGRPVQFDFIIVGGGTAGCILASRLTEISKWTVLLIEAGGDPRMTSQVPKYYMSQQLSCIDWKFITEREEGLYSGMLNQRNRWPAGKVLGGSSTMGRMMYLRGHPEDYNHWEELGNPGWSYKDLLHHFKKAEDVRDDSIRNCSDLKDYHGVGGYITLDTFKSKESLITHLKIAAKELAYQDIRDSSGIRTTGYLSILATIKDGERHGTAKAYLSTIRDRPNLFVVKYSHVTKILFSGKRAVGVEYKWRNETKLRIAMVKKEIIIAAGTINSAQLLLLSGIGPSKHLSSMGIPVLSDLYVGCNLQDHVAFGGAVITINKTKASVSIERHLDYTYEYLSRRSGIMSNIQESELIGLIGLTSDEKPDIQIFHLFFRQGDLENLHMWAATLNLTPKIIDMYIKYLLQYDLLIMMPILLRPQSKGRLLLRSCDPMDPPLIDSGHLRAPKDVDQMLSAIRYIREMVDTVILKEHEAEIKRMNFPSCCEEQFDTDGYWVCALSNIATTFNDYAGTNKMGPPDDNKAVVDPLLRVYGVKGLRVADASIIPVIPGANLLATTVAIAEKASAMITSDWLSVSSGFRSSTPTNITTPE